MSANNVKRSERQVDPDDGQSDTTRQNSAWKARIDAKAKTLTTQNASTLLTQLPFHAVAAMRMAIQLPQGTLTVEMPDGRVLRAGGNAPGPDAIVVLRNWKLPRRALLHGTVGVGESYMDGDWTSPDITIFLELFCVNEEIGNAVAGSRGLKVIFHRILHWLNANTKRRARKNIAAHYDLGNRFYEQWLDRSMTYSAGIFSAGANDLYGAQQAKYRRLADTAGITAHDHVLEIGCGWGGFAEFAAREIGCSVTGLTISREQLDYARQRIHTAGLDDKVKLKYQDYRDETGLYDKVVSIEMFEAVGEEYWDVYFSKLSDVLKPGGRVGLQVITIADDGYEIYRRQPDFIQRYIFPGGMLPTPSRMDELGKTAGLDLHDRFLFPQDYARTLALWRERFWSAWETIAPMGFDERFKSMWEFYLHYCEAGFRAEFIDVRQLVYTKPA